LPETVVDEEEEEDAFEESEGKDTIEEAGDEAPEHEQRAMAARASTERRTVCLFSISPIPLCIVASALIRCDQRPKRRILPINAVRFLGKLHQNHGSSQRSFGNPYVIGYSLNSEVAYAPTGQTETHQHKMLTSIPLPPKYIITLISGRGLSNISVPENRIFTMRDAASFCIISP
jgi:hypothetical protein